MKFEIKDLGIVKEANLELKDLTIITGKNNSGKTYITETCYAILKDLDKFFKINILQSHFETFIKEQSVIFNINDYLEQINDNIDKIIHSFKKNRLHSTFASEQKHFLNTQLNLKLDKEKDYTLNNFKKIGLLGEYDIDVSNIGDKKIKIELNKPLINQQKIKKSKLLNATNHILTLFLEMNFFPSSKYLCAERSGILQFQMDIDGNRSQLINEIQNNEKIYVNEFLDRNTGKFPLVVSDSLDSVREIRNRGIKEPFSIRKNVKENIEKIIGGQFEVIDKKILFNPNIESDLKLNLSETSSSVCSLIELNYDLLKTPGTNFLLFIDEPEMNLHPINQREIARLIVLLINQGYKIIISTHSDIIIREINTMILLNNPTKKNIRKEEGYSEFETLNVKKLNCYTTEQNNDLTYSLKQIPVSQEEGISVESFDKTIEEINRIQDRLLWE
ncbi:MAG: AAA family ATPase [Pleomorphochaeta sp.]